MDSPEVSFAAMSERIGALNQKIEAMHGRHDKMEVEIKSVLKELTLELKILQKDLTKDMKEIQAQFANDMKASQVTFNAEMKDLYGFVNRSKGWAAAAILLATLVGATIVKLWGK